MKIAIACDHSGIELKDAIKSYLTNRQIPFMDFGTHHQESCDYPLFAEKVCKAVINQSADLGILICGTGVGMSISANKYTGIRAVVCSEPYSAILARRHNNANVLCLGARVVASGLAAIIVEGFLSASFEGGRHQTRLDLIERLHGNV